jgi:hypothetical protein
MHPSSKHYPRGMPFQPPQPAARTPSGIALPSWPVRREWWFAAAAGLVLLGVAAALVFSNRSSNAAPVPTAPVPNERMLETLGGLSAAHLYQSYLNIGLLADAVDNKTYTQAQALEMLTTVVGLMDTVDKQLDRLARNDLSADDKRDVERIRSLSALLRVQVVALRLYWSTGSGQQAVRYHEARDKAWQGLSAVLGL